MLRKKSHGFNMSFTGDHVVSQVVTCKTHVQHTWTSHVCFYTFFFACNHMGFTHFSHVGFIWKMACSTCGLLPNVLHV